jgi:arsenite methyltransferase
MKKYLRNDLDFSKLIDVYDELPIWSAPFGLKLLDYVVYKPNISAIDIGFGTGFPLIELAMRLGDSCIVYGIDPWKDAIEKVKIKINCYGISNIRIIEGVAESIQLEQDSVDLITSNNGINNVNDIDKVLSECSRIIKKNGQFVLAMNLDKSMFEFYKQLEYVLSNMRMDKEIELLHQHISKKRPPIDSIVSMLEKHSFIIKDLEHDQFNYKFTNATAMLNHYFIRVAFMDSWIELLPEDKAEQIFDAVELRLNRQSKKSGGLKLSIPFILINARKN